MKKLIFHLMLLSSLQNYAQQAKVYTTSKTENRAFSAKGTYQFVPQAQPKEIEVFLFLNPDKTFQTFEGIGGAITDAAAETFYKMSSKKQEEILEAYYGKNGIGYTIIRTNMNSCDFSSASYTYIEAGDKELKTFDISHDLTYKIPLIKAAQSKIGTNMKFYFSPWSPPAWMKSNQSMLKGGSLLPEYYNSWANYYIKFIQAYQKQNIPIWGLTIQNEPLATQTWESCIYTAEQERDFLKNYLGPALWKNKMKDKKVIIWDHNRDLIYQRASVILADKEAYKYVWGIGYHWYETWTKSEQLYEGTEETKKAYPDKSLIFTEGCKEKFDYNNLNDWSLGELYGENMIHDFNNGTSAWTDWNIMLDQTGGPNHVGNYCFAPIIANTQTDEVIYTNEYSYIGHFSKYIKQGAKRIGIFSNRDSLLATAFKNPNGEIVIISMNQTANALTYKIWLNGKAIPLEADAHSISTILIQ